MSGASEGPRRSLADQSEAELGGPMSVGALRALAGRVERFGLFRRGERQSTHR
jgi:hypothetical protein